MVLIRYWTVLFVISLFGFCSAKGQTLTTPDLNKSLIPPAPDAASLGTYGILPVTLYTGMANVSVPVYELKSSKFSVPISLSYNYNGFQPGMEASWVGLGWSLKAGGVITRVVKGINDEYPGSGGTYLYKWQMYANILDMTSNMDFMAAVGNRMADTEPDIYIFNFNGHSGKFILVGNRAYLFPAQDLKIVQSGIGFNITDEQGVTYSFQDADTTYPNNNTNPGSYMPIYISSWYLTKMTTADNTDEIDFKYAAWTERQSNAMYQESYQRQTGGQKSQTACNGFNNTCDTWTQIDYSGGVVSARRLTSVSCKAGYVNFVPEDAHRTDINTLDGYALKEIDVFRPDSLLIKKTNLTHSYFGGTAQPLELTSVNTTGYFVNTIQGSGGGTIDSIAIPGYYTFQYNGLGMPKGTRGIDSWGFYNGKDGNMMLFDSTIVPYQAIYPFADRSVNPSASMVGTLSDIYYPTGGHSHFTYEGNLVTYPGDNRKRIRKYAGNTTIYNSSDGDSSITWGSFTLDSAQTVQISYGRTFIAADTTFGALNLHAVLRIYQPGVDTPGAPPPALMYTSPPLGKSVTSNTGAVSLPAGSYTFIVVAENTDINSYATLSYLWLDSTFLGDPGPGLRIKTITSYDNLDTAPALIRNYTYSLATVLSASGSYGVYSVQHEWSDPSCSYGGTYTEYVFSSSGSNSPLSTLIDNQIFYPSVTEINKDSTGAGKTVYEYAGDGTDALGVYLTRQTDYSYRNGSFLPVKQKTNTYSMQNFINFQAFTHNVSQIIDPTACLVPPLIGPNQLDTIDRDVLYSASSYILGSNYNYLTTTDDVTYDQNGANPMTIHTDYYYDNANYFQPSRTVVANSKGYLITTQTKYPLDYTYTPCTPLYTVDTAFRSARDSASIQYQECTINRYNAALPYLTPAIQNEFNTALLNVLRSYPCESTYASNYASAVSTMNTNTFNYYGCLAGNGIMLPDAQSAIVNMQYANIKTAPVEQIVTINRGDTDYLFGANKTDYTVNHLYGASPKTLFQTNITSTSILASDFQANPGNYYEPRVNFVYDELDNILQQSKTNDMNMSYIWDYQRLYPIAQVNNADTGSIAYTSFEADGTGNWSVPSGGITTAASGITGSKSYLLPNGAISKTGLNLSQTYIVAFWLQNGGSATVSGGSAPVAKLSKLGWTCYESTVTGVSVISISGSGYIDELRLHPAGAQMTTYTYDPLIGITGSCGPNYQLMYYYYDPLARLKYVKDCDGNILKTLEYHYGIQ